MYTVAQAARSANVSGTTIRNWSRMYADYLSPSANPLSGTPREFTADDLSVFSTIAVLRDQLQETEAIRAALDEGQRLEPLHPPPHEQPTADRAGQADPAAAADQAERAADRAAAETAIAIYRDRVTQLETRADQLADRLIAAEARAAAAERELAILRELHTAADPGHKMSFWEWVQSRRR